MEKQINETGCCPRFNPEPWQDVVVNWENRKFVKGKVKSLMFMPLNFGQVIRKLEKKTREAGGEFVENICLSDHTSKWNMDIYLAVNKDIPDVENTTLSGNFYCKAYEGDFRNTGEWCKDFEQSAKAKGFQTGKQYLWYTTCPKCAKFYGKNYTVIITEIQS
jgi:hypothetical protein